MALRADLTLDAYSHIGYDALNVGELDLSLGRGFLLEKRSQAQFPFISSNLTDIHSGNPLFEPYTVREVDGLRVGVFGLISPVFKSRLQDGAQISLEDPFETARRMVTKLNRCDLIIALTLLQGQEEAESLAARVPGINIVISGCGSPLLDPVRVDSTIIVQTRPRGEALGRLDLNMINSSRDFQSASERETVSNNLRATKGALESFRRRAEGQELSEYYRDDSLALEEIERLSEREKDLEKALQAFSGCSYYRNSLIRLDDSHPDDPDVSRMVGEYKQKLAQLKEKPPAS